MEIRFDDVTYKNKYKDMDFSIYSKYIYGIFLEDSITFEKLLTKELPILVKLYDVIESEISVKYCEYKKNSGVARPQFGRVKGVEYIEKGTETEFLGGKTNYAVSSGYLYPIFGAFRALLKFDEEEGMVSWLFDPVDIWEKIGASIAQNTFETSNNPQLAGKDKQLWLSNYRIVETQSLRMLLDKAK